MTAVIVLAVVAFAVVLTRGDDAADAPGASPSSSVSATPSASAPANSGHEVTVERGVFRTTDREAVADFGRWAGSPVDYVVDFSARDSWQDIADPQYMLDEWKGTGLRPVYGVAMLPREGGASLEQGARGRYDRYFAELARNLVEADQADAILRVGWEFNLSSWPWSTDSPETFVAYYRSIVEAMRSVPGQRFEFDWNVNNGDGNKYDAALYYPGGDVVDYIGVDAYDVSGRKGTYPYPADCDSTCRAQRQQRAWDTQIYGGDRGLRFWSQFAREKGKPLSLPEWGAWDRLDKISGGENPGYIERMYRFIDDPANNVAYQAYFEYDGDDGKAKHSLQSSFPRSGEKYRSLFTPR